MLASEDRCSLFELVVEIGWFLGLKNFISSIVDFAFNPLFEFKPMEEFENTRDVLPFRGFEDCTR